MDDITAPPSQVVEGMSASLTRRVGDEAVQAFAEATGDTNPLHLDAEIAAASIFGARVAHGMLSAGLISAVLGTHLPGPGTIYLAQTLRFKRPIYLGDTVTARLTVTRVDEARGECELDAQVTNQEGRIVVEGEAHVRLP